MAAPIRMTARGTLGRIRLGCFVICACGSATLMPVGVTVADPPQGAVVGWGSQVVGVDLSQGFVAVAAGLAHSLGLKGDGSIVVWGGNGNGQTNVPAPNTGFIAVAGGFYHSLGLKPDLYTQVLEPIGADHRCYG